MEQHSSENTSATTQVTQLHPTYPPYWDNPSPHLLPVHQPRWGAHVLFLLSISMGMPSKHMQLQLTPLKPPTPLPHLFTQQCYLGKLPIYYLV